MREEQQLLVENLFSSVKKEKTKKDDSSFLKMSDIYPNYPQFVKEKNILGAKTYVEDKRSNIISRYTNFLWGRDETALGLGSFILMLVSFFYLVVVGANIYKGDSVFEMNFMIFGGVLAFLWALIIMKCKAYDKIDKEENEENNRKAQNEENKNLINEKREINKRINHNYIKELLKSDNEYMDDLKNKYVDDLSYISIYQLETLDKKLQDDIKYINLSRVKK